MKKIVWFAVGLALALCLGSAGAYFTGQAQVPDNVIRAGAVSVSAEPTSAALSVGDIAPGETCVRSLTVRNSGSLAADYVVTGAKKLGITDFYNALTCTVKNGDTTVYQGPMNALRTTAIRLAPGESARLEFAMGLPATSGNDLAGDYVRMTLYVDGEQTH